MSRPGVVVQLVEARAFLVPCCKPFIVAPQYVLEVLSKPQAWGELVLAQVRMKHRVVPLDKAFLQMPWLRSLCEP